MPAVAAESDNVASTERKERFEEGPKLNVELTVETARCSGGGRSDKPQVSLEAH